MAGFIIALANDYFVVVPVGRSGGPGGASRLDTKLPRRGQSGQSSSLAVSGARCATRSISRVRTASSSESSLRSAGTSSVIKNGSVPLEADPGSNAAGRERAPSFS